MAPAITESWSNKRRPSRDPASSLAWSHLLLRPSLARLLVVHYRPPPAVFVSLACFVPLYLPSHVTLSLDALAPLVSHRLSLLFLFCLVSSHNHMPSCYTIPRSPTDRYNMPCVFSRTSSERDGEMFSSVSDKDGIFTERSAKTRQASSSTELA